jgi:predicted deacylase
MTSKQLIATVLFILCVVIGYLVFRVNNNPQTLRLQPQIQSSDDTLLVNQQLIDLYEKADHRQILNVKTIGHSTEGRPIYLFKLSSGVGHKKIFVMCRQHGHEPGSTIAFLQLLQAALEDGAMDSYLKKTDIYVVPETNPDGAADYTRWDSGGNDLNREWDKPSAPEILAIKSTIAALHPTFVMDMHDYGRGGSFIEAYNDGSKASAFVGPVCRAIREQIKKHSDPTCRVAYSNLKNNPGLSHRVIIHQFGIPAILVESQQSPRYTSDAKCIMSHKIAFTTALRFLAAK